MRFARKLSITLATTVAMFCVLEAIVRIVLPASSFAREPRTPRVARLSNSPDIGYELKPGAHDRIDYPALDGYSARSVDYAINEDGFRDEMFVRPKSNSTYRIAVMGDSFTFGIGVPPERTFPKVMQERLRERFHRRGIEVMNCGVFGYNTTNEVALLNDRVWAYEPDAVYVCFFMNDVIPTNPRLIGPTPELTWIRRLGLTDNEPDSAGGGARTRAMAIAQRFAGDRPLRSASRQEIEHGRLPPHRARQLGSR
jgi:hypothetical protein